MVSRKQRGVSTPLRWMLLLALLLLLFASMPSNLVRAEEDEDAVDFDEDAEDLKAEAVDEEPVPEPEPEPEPVQEKEAEPVAQEAASVPVPDEPKKKGDSAPSLVSKAKGAVGPIVDKLVSKGTSAIDRIKGMSKSDAKKVAAAALGIWGVSVGVGWLAQTANKN
jgi:hypothetical protein